MRWKFTFALTLTLSLLLLPPARSALDFTGTTEIRYALAKINVLGSVLLIGAHPDDENNALVSYVSRGMKMRFGYLSCTRGEGGQNLIGGEMGEGLGVIRTQELLAARRIDGGNQFFTRAIDFGFTLSAPEAIEKWGRDRILSDMVWVIRTQRPDVVLLSFSGTPADGHGHHQASAILGKEAFEAAGDPAKFPEQLKFVQPWKPTRLARSRFDQNADAKMTRISIDAGDFDTVFGRSYAEIGTLSRGEHKSQAQAGRQSYGTRPMTVANIAGPEMSKTIADGIDTTWNRVPNGAPIGALLAKAEANFDDRHPEKTVPLLVEARALIVRSKDPWAKWKLGELDETIALCAAVRVAAESDRATVAPGGRVKVSLEAIVRSNTAVRLMGVHLSGWVEQDAAPKHPALVFNKTTGTPVEITVPASHGYSQPFWLAAKHTSDYYEINDQKLIGRADIVPELTARFDLAIGGATIQLERPIQFRFADPARAEFIRPVAVEPLVAVELPSPNLIVPFGQPREVSVQLRARFGAANGSLALQLPPGWQVTPANAPFTLKDQGEVREFRFRVTPPTAPQSAQFQAIATLADGTKISTGIQVVDYAHIPTQTIFHPAEGRLNAVSLQTLSKRIGYVMGAADDIPQALRQMGVAVDLLGEKELTTADLSKYDAIVTGVRAPAVRPDLRASQQRLLDYVSQGGTLVVQYNKNTDRRMSKAVDDALNHLGPYPFTFGDNNHRVTQEDAPVKFVDPKNPILNTPNRITAADFDGWVQERGLYFSDKWDPKYSTVIESHDKGKPDLPGGILYTRYGKGVYIFTAYSWFRQLPAGVPGAYRLFANMISAGQSGKPKP